MEKWEQEYEELMALAKKVEKEFGNDPNVTMDDLAKIWKAKDEVFRKMTGAKMSPDKFKKIVNKKREALGLNLLK